MASVFGTQMAFYQYTLVHSSWVKENDDVDKAN